MTYPGGKAGAGVFQKIINEIPPHDLYIEPFLGDGAILRNLRPAARRIAIELDDVVAAAFRDEVLDVELHCCCGIEWLKHRFDLYRLQGPPPDSEASAEERFASRCFVYMDPPYLLASRRGGRIYRHELDRAQHVELLDVACRLPCMVAISGYASSLYAEALAGWRLITFETMTRGGPAIEHLWLNYPPPAALHDYRYLGRNKREREKLKRRVVNWTEGLARLPPLERQQIESAIAEQAASGAVDD